MQNYVSLDPDPLCSDNHSCRKDSHLQSSKKKTPFNSNYQRWNLVAAMKSLRRDLSSNPQAANVTSKVFVRSTKSGKVQKIVRELYLREDIPCSSKLCSQCPTTAPADANGNSKDTIHGSIEAIANVKQLRRSFCLIAPLARQLSPEATTLFPILMRC
jgi:hypothetical protein